MMVDILAVLNIEVPLQNLMCFASLKPVKSEQPYGR